MLVKWNSMFDKEWEDMFWLGKPLLKYSPPVDICEDENGFIIEAELPGMKEEDVEITFENKLLTISGKKETKETKEIEKKIYRTERTTGTFSRSFSFPEMVNPENIKANFSNGLLTIEIPKALKKEPTKVKIKLSSS
jgi:HSP20 family protein